MCIRDSGYTEWLARKPGQQNLVIRDIPFINLGNVTDKCVIQCFRKVSEIGFLCKFVPFTGKYTLSAVRLKTKAYSADTRSPVSYTHLVTGVLE